MSAHDVDVLHPHTEKVRVTACTPATTGFATCAKQSGTAFKETLVRGISHITADELKRSIIKATGLDLDPIPEKHLMRIVNGSKGAYTCCGSVDEANDRIIDELKCRMHNNCWVVACKALIVVRRLMLEGSAVFVSRLMARKTEVFDLTALKPFVECHGGESKYAPMVQRYFMHCHALLSTLDVVPAETLLAAFRNDEVVTRIHSDEMYVQCNAIISMFDQLSDADQINLFTIDNHVSLEVFRNFIADGKLGLVTATRYMGVAKSRAGICPMVNKSWVETMGNFDSALKKLSRFFDHLRVCGIEFADPIPHIRPLPEDFFQEMRRRVERCKATLPTVTLAELLAQQQHRAAAPESDRGLSTSGSDAPSTRRAALEAMQPQFRKDHDDEAALGAMGLDVAHMASPLIPLHGRGSVSDTSDSLRGVTIDNDSDGDDSFAPRAARPSTNSSVPRPTHTPPQQSAEMQRIWQRFSIERNETLGKGAFGTVYKAWDSDEGKHVAVKEVRLDHGETEETSKLDALRGEFKTLLDLDHPNIVRVIDLAIDDVNNYGYIFMEWMPSGSLQSVLRKMQPPKGPGALAVGLKPKVVARYAGEMLQGLAFLHTRNLLHRDVKPANVLLNAAGVAKLSDFGTTKHWASLTGSFKTTTVVGTIAYLAPECLQGTYSPGSDIWALGCSVLEMLTGLEPWAEMGARDQIQLIFRIGSARPPNHMPQIPPAETPTFATTTPGSFSNSESQNQSLAASDSSSFVSTASTSRLSDSSVKFISAAAHDFLLRCFEYDYHRRPSAEELLRHPFIAGVSPH